MTSITAAPFSRLAEDILNNSIFKGSQIGFDRVIADVFRDLAEDQSGHPFYDIIKTGDDTFVIGLALAGYQPEEVDIMLEKGVLTISHAPKDKATGPDADDLPGREYIHRGISKRPFERMFKLAEHIEVTGATFANGILSVALQRNVPDEAKPKRIAIEAK